jgi:N utilization substance protein B
VTESPAAPASSRRAARKRALDVLYEADLRDRPLPEVLAAHLEPDAPDPLPEFALVLVRGVHRHREEIDGLISEHARGWRLPRMPVIDRNVLRMGVFELLHAPEIPRAVAINEAVALAKELSTDDSGRFVNGLLSRITKADAAAT